MAKAKKPTAKKVVKKSPSKKKVSVKKSAPKKKATKGKKREDLMCFLTTACVSYYGLSDAGYELNTLRKFRDEFLMKSSSGKMLVCEYYEIAPKIVSAINKSKTSASSYNYIYSVIHQAIAQIEKGQLEKAEQSYSNMVTKLRSQFID